jgi:hypothetical protein
MGRKPKVKIVEQPIVCFVFKGDRGLVWWQTNWFNDQWDILENLKEAQQRALWVRRAGINVFFVDPNCLSCYECQPAVKDGNPVCGKCGEPLYNNLPDPEKEGKE